MSEYSFVTKEGEDHASVRIENGRFKGVVYNYGRVSLPQEDDLNEDGTMPFSFAVSYTHLTLPTILLV